MWSGGREMPSQQNIIINEATATRKAKQADSRGVLRLNTNQF